MRHINFSSIKQFDDIYDRVDKMCKKSGKELPRLTFEGTVAVKGIPAAICYSRSKKGYIDFWTQYEDGLVNKDNDEHGFVQFVEDKFIDIEREIGALADSIGLLEGQDIAVFGQFCGNGIQEEYAISKLESTFIVSDVQLVSGDHKESIFKDRVFSSENPTAPEGFHNVHDFVKYNAVVDFKNVKTDLINEFTGEVEKRCPVADALGSEGKGAGIVWVAQYEDATLRFLTENGKQEALPEVPEVEEKESKEEE